MEEINQMADAQNNEPVENTSTPTPVENAPQPAATAAESATPATEPTAPATDGEQLPTTDAPAQEAANFEEPDTDYSNCSREELADALKALLDEEVTHIKNRVQKIRTRFNDLQKEQEEKAFKQFLDEGGAKENYEPKEDAASQSFRKAYATYRKRRQEHLDALEAEKLKNLKAKEKILDDLKALIESNEESLKKANDEFKNLQECWKQVGEVPREQLNDLWQRYHFLLEQFFNKMKMGRELRDLDLKRNLEQKIVLCEKAEELIVESSITKAFKGLQDLRAQWKEIGPVPTEQNEEIWNRFCTAANKIDERRKEYYDQRKEEQDKNLLAKQALVEQAEQLTEKMPESTKEWNDTSAALDKLLALWKTIGPVPREVNEEIWSKFKGIIDKHYEQKKEHFGQIRDEQSENYNKKIDLCLKAEAIAKREDWKKATEELLQLQKEWKEIGSVSRKVSEKIWQRFRGACDEFFARKKEYYNNIHGSEQENMQKKEAIIAQLKEFEFGESKEENLRVIKDFQRQWMEIGYVPMGEKERLQKEFRAVIDAHFEKLKISAREAEESAYRERLKNAGADAKRFVNSEKEELMQKIEKLRSDIKLWENNLGFLASSRQADLLKQEFEKKMQGARQQIALLEAKLRILKESEKAEKTEKGE